MLMLTIERKCVTNKGHLVIYVKDTFEYAIFNVTGNNNGERVRKRVRRSTGDLGVGQVRMSL